MLTKMRHGQYDAGQTKLVELTHQYPAGVIVLWPVVTSGQQQIALLQPLGDIWVIDDVNPSYIPIQAPGSRYDGSLPQDGLL
ncbi:hypothetical protein D3C85_1754470 [compost metagenome]